MKPFHEKGQFRDDLPSPASTSPSFVPSKFGFGVEIRYGRDIKKRKNLLFVSSGKWAEMGSDGIIDQEVSPAVIGELIDPLSFVPFSDADERKSPELVLSSGEIVQGQSIDLEGDANKDGRITIFGVRSRGYVVNEEIPHKTRGPKVESESFNGISSGILKAPFLDGGGSSLGIEREGFYGIEKVLIDPFTDREIENDFNMVLSDTGDYDASETIGTNGFSLYSSEFGTDSIAFLGLLR